ncbi:MAG TPA: hypothetical protein VFQ20_01600 [Burkholderiaceae bacterium]|nr:hypothetical protein [Burkholderiaceae bacterium]
MSSPTATDDTVPHIAHDEFRAGARYGRFRIIVDPALARPWVVRRTRVDLLAIVLIGAGAVLALGGQAWTGLVLVALGIAANRATRWQAGKIVLHLAERNPAVYREVTEGGIVEVRRRE